MLREDLWNPLYWIGGCAMKHMLLLPNKPSFTTRHAVGFPSLPVFAANVMLPMTTVGGHNPVFFCHKDTWHISRLGKIVLLIKQDSILRELVLYKSPCSCSFSYQFLFSN